MRRIMAEQRANLPKRVRQAGDLPLIHDQAAHARLLSALVVAVDRLEVLGTDPIVIAASANRFNDIYWSDWRAIRFGTFFTERHDYGAPVDYEQDLRAGPAGARLARDVLDRLEDAGWRDNFVDAFGIRRTDQALSLVLQDGLAWLVFNSSNNSDENHVFALWDEQPLAYFGECVDRFDWEMQETPPLRFQIDD
jgi:hypothetical protein